MNLNLILTYLLYVIHMVEKILLRFINQSGSGDYSDWDDIMNPPTTAAPETTAPETTV